MGNATVFRAGNVNVVKPTISRWPGAAFNCIGQVQPINFITLKNGGRILMG